MRHFCGHRTVSTAMIGGNETVDRIVVCALDLDHHPQYHNESVDGLGFAWGRDVPDVIEQEIIRTASDEHIAKTLAGSGDHVAQFFTFAHLPQPLREVSRLFATLAATVVDLPRNPERTVCLRKLLEAKDAAVRAKLAK